jgi:chemotaxis protein methyltransferase CheR
MNISINKIIHLLSEKYSLDISVHDKSFLAKSIESRMKEKLISTIADYLVYLGDTPAESMHLYKSLKNSYSVFFRNPMTFLILEQLVIPKMISKKERKRSGELRIWSAGCGSGQEPYSLAMIVSDLQSTHAKNLPYRIFATDISKIEIDAAKKGVYDLKTIQNIRIGTVNKYFSNSGAVYSIDPKLKENVYFSVYDLLDNKSTSPPSSIYGDFDIVMCSNLLFYYKRKIQKKILDKLSGSLADGGFLVTGEAETGIVISHMGFKQHASHATIFIKV